MAAAMHSRSEVRSPPKSVVHAGMRRISGPRLGAVVDDRSVSFALRAGKCHCGLPESWRCWSFAYKSSWP
jgi:hypothetical protein